MEFIIARLKPAFSILVFGAAAVCLVTILINLSDATTTHEDDGALAPTFSILHGNPPFYNLDQGPMLSTNYGPLSYLYYAPSCLFASSITSALLSASFLSFIAFAIPVGLIIYSRRDMLSPLQEVWLAVLCCLQILYYGGLNVPAFTVHADAPAILLSSLGVLALDRREGEITSRRALLLSVTCAVLTAWTKQTYVAVLLLPLVIALAEKQTWHTRFLVFIWAPVLVAIIFLIFSAWSGPRAIFENMIEVPLHNSSGGQANFLYGAPDHAATASSFRSIVVAAHIQVGKFLTPYIVCILLYLLVGLWSGKRSPGDRFMLRVPRRATLFFLVAVFNLPMCAKAAINLCGPSVTDDTSFSWFIVLGIFSMVVEMKIEPSFEDFLRLSRPIYVGFIGIAMISLVTLILHLPQRIGILTDTFNPEKLMITEACRQSPGKYYFPLNPLASYLGEGKFYHYIYFVEVRSAIGLPLSQDHFNRYIPPQASVIGMPQQDGKPAPTYFLAEVVDDLEPCPGPAIPGANHFNWYSFTRKP